MEQRGKNRFESDTKVRLGVALAALGVAVCFVLAGIMASSSGTLGKTRANDARITSLEAASG